MTKFGTLCKENVKMNSKEGGSRYGECFEVGELWIFQDAVQIGVFEAKRFEGL